MASLAFDRVGSGPPLLLLHGTNSSRRVWKPLLPELTRKREVIAVDLPGHGESPPGGTHPEAWAAVLAAWLDELQLPQVSIVGHSSGGWTSLELAKLGRARAALAVTPAGCWKRRSPLLTDAFLWGTWRLGRVLPEKLQEGSMKSAAGRWLGLRSLTVRPRAVPVEEALDLVRAAATASPNFGAHFAATRKRRFLHGDRIDPAVPVTVVWGAKDRIARPRLSTRRDQLPEHARIEIWLRCGHMAMWDQPDRLVSAALALP